MAVADFQQVSAKSVCKPGIGTHVIHSAVVSETQLAGSYVHRCLGGGNVVGRTCALDRAGGGGGGSCTAGDDDGPTRLTRTTLSPRTNTCSH